MKHNIYAAKIIDGWSFFSDIRSNGLYKMNLTTGEVLFVDLFEGCLVQERKIHRVAVQAGERIFFIPQHGRHFHYYDVKEGGIYLLEYKSDGSGRFSDAVPFEDKIYLTPLNTMERLSYINPEKLSIDRDHRFDSFYERLGENTVVTKRAVRRDDSIWFGLYGTDIVIEFNLKTGGWKKYRCDVNDISGVFYSENGLWITSCSKDCIYYWDQEKTTTYFCEVSGTEPINRIMNFAQVIEHNNSVYAIKNSENPLYKLGDAGFTNIKLPAEYLREDGWPVDFFCYEKYENKMYLFPVSGNAVIVIDKQGKIVLLPISDKTKGKYGDEVRERIKNTGEIFTEDTYFGLGSFLEII